MRIRFDSFEVDATSGELRKNGIRLRLQPQPFRVLLLLIEASGQVVTREEIRDCLWKGSTFVDFEHGINFSINQIRGALSDNAEHPRYVETLPRRGYRFIGTVERTHLPIHDSAPEILSPEILSPEILAQQTQAPDIPALPCEAKPVVATAYWRRWTVIASLAVLAAAIAGTYFFRFVSRRQHVLTSQDTIVLADFTKHNRRPGVRWNTSQLAGGAAETIAVLERALGRAHPADTAADGPAA